MGVCPFADQSRRYDALYPQSYRGGPTKGVLHTTETSVLPGYSNGGNAPHVTGVPDFDAKRVKWYQHFDTNRPARALRDLSGGVQTNNDGVFQIELVGTCSTRGPGMFWPEAPEWALEDVRRMMAWAEQDMGIPHVQPSEGWLSYPASYGNTSVRMSPKRWDDYAGWCGHQHVPENDHGDPGDMSALFEEDEVTPQDIKDIAAAVWRHQLADPRNADGTGTTAERWLVFANIKAGNAGVAVDIAALTELLRADVVAAVKEGVTQGQTAEVVADAVVNRFGKKLAQADQQAPEVQP